MRNIQQELRQFVIDNFLFGQGNGNLHNDDSFLDKGIIDSTGVLELVTFLEEKYHVKIHDHELVTENLDSVNNLVRFIETKLEQAP
ncbi:MAG TPA: acyl carrier protein [Candidatus Acidoferrum sp.]|nr:acyl carrier protein [Candidatus Acidoferrum sp.]